MRVQNTERLHLPPKSLLPCPSFRRFNCMHFRLLPRHLIPRFPDFYFDEVNRKHLSLKHNLLDLLLECCWLCLVRWARFCCCSFWYAVLTPLSLSLSYLSPKPDAAFGLITFWSTICSTYSGEIWIKVFKILFTIACLCCCLFWYAHLTLSPPPISLQCQRSSVWLHHFLERDMQHLFRREWISGVFKFWLP